MATHCSIFAWEIPRTEEPGGLQSRGSKRVRHEWLNNNKQVKVTCAWCYHLAGIPSVCSTELKSVWPIPASKTAAWSWAQNETWGRDWSPPRTRSRSTSISCFLSSSVFSPLIDTLQSFYHGPTITAAMTKTPLYPTVIICDLVTQKNKSDSISNLFLLLYPLFLLLQVTMLDLSQKAKKWFFFAVN